MTTPSVPKRPVRDDFSGDYAEDLDGLLTVIGDAQESLVNAASTVVTPYFRTDLFTHAVEKRIRSPLPIGMKCTAVSVVKSIGVTIGTDGRPTTATTAIQTTGNPYWRSIGSTQDGGEVIGVTLNYDQSTTGIIGESNVMTVGPGAAVALATNTVKTVASFTLTAGEWDICGVVLLGGTLTGTVFQMGVGATVDSFAGCTDALDFIYTPTMSTGNTQHALTLPPFRRVITSNTALYLSTKAVFTAGTASAYGSIRATREKKYDTALTGKITMMFFGE